jgi:hypothetical protein
MFDTFEIKLNCVVLTTNIPLNKKYVLSLDKDNIIIPSLNLTKELLSNDKLDSQIIEFLKQYIFVSDLELFPQLISLHSSHLNSTEVSLNTIYGFLVNYTNSLNNCYWVEFDYLQPVDCMPLLIEVIQRLK